MRHRFHAICPYFAMFPELFVRKHLIWSKPGDVVFDPFSGRGTTVFECLLNERMAAGCDINPVAVCVSNAKADPPTYREAIARINELEALPHEQDFTLAGNSEFFEACFHRETLVQILHLRKHLNWRRRRVDRFIAAIALGCLHGESHRSSNYFSNRMPRTISTKPDYSVRWWQKNGYVAPKRDVYRILRAMVDYRFASEPPRLRGKVASCDARRAAEAFPDLRKRVSLVITSPPYLDTTNFAEDQWLRAWFLGGAPFAPRARGDHRHYNVEKYWSFLTEAWMGIRPLLKKDAHLVIRMGGKKLSREEIKQGLQATLEKGLRRDVRLVEQRSTKIVDGQLRAFRPGASGVQHEHDFHFAFS